MKMHYFLSRRALYLICAVTLIVGWAASVDAEKTRSFHRTFGDWIAECKIDRMTDAERCIVHTGELGHRNHRFDLIEELDLDNVGSGTILGSGLVRLTNLEVRVDKNPAVQGHCGVVEDKLGGGAVTNICNFGDDTAPSGQPLIVQLRGGKQMLIRVHFSDETAFEKDFSLIDMRRALDAVNEEHEHAKRAGREAEESHQEAWSPRQ